jgi:hypothetical protein
MTAKSVDMLHSCSPSPDCFYRLPWSTDEQWNLQQGNWDDPNGPRHETVDGAPQSYSYDFEDVRGGEGHPVRAARGGRVAFAYSTQAENIWDKKIGDPGFPPGTRGEGNMVVIQHMDGTAAAYCHLQKGRVFVEKDEYVPRGRIIALSGNTGNSATPHLHFDVHPYFTSWDDLDPATGEVVKRNWVPTMKVRFEDGSRHCYRPNVGDAMSSNNLVTSAQFSCLLGPRQGQHSCVAGLSFEEFVGVWTYLGDPPLNNDGTRPPRSDMLSFSVHQSDGRLKFNGVFGPGKGGQQFVAGLDFKAFTDFWVKVGSTPSNKSDMITFATYVAGGVRKFAGLFGPGNGGQQFVAGLDFKAFTDLWVKAGSTPTNKSDMITFATYVEGGVRKFAGLFGPGKGGQQFVAGLNFKAFTDLWVGAGSTPPSKSEMITFSTYIEDGVRKFAGLFGPGPGGQQFVSPVSYDDLVKLWLESRKHGNHPLQVMPH